MEPKEKLKWFLFTPKPSWEICSNVCVEKLGWSHVELWGLSDLHTLPVFMDLLGFLCLSVSLGFNLFNGQLI